MPRKRTKKTKLPQWFDECSDVIAIVDSNFQVIYANQACSRWLGISSDTLIGHQLQYSSEENEAGKTNPANGICPNPDIFAVPPTEQHGFIYSSIEQKQRWRKATFSRLNHGEDETQIVLVVGSGPDLSEPVSGDQRTELVELHELLAKQNLANERTYSIANLIGTSDFALRLKRQVEAVAGNQSDCLITGPNGSGREHLARTIFNERNLNDARLVPIHCAIADSQFIQSSIKEWVFDQRSSDTKDWLLLLDIDCLSSEGQLELLGFSQLPDFQLRVIATSQQPLLGQSTNSEPAYNQSLASFLSVQTIELIPLKDRKQDIPIITQKYVELANQTSRKQFTGLSDEALELFLEYNWPRNIDELQRIVKEACEHCKSRRIGVDDLPSAFRHGISAARIGYHQQESIDLDQFLAKIERELIARALKATNNNRTKAAESLGISRARLLRRATALGLSKTDAKTESNVVDESAFKPAD